MLIQLTSRPHESGSMLPLPPWPRVADLRRESDPLGLGRRGGESQLAENVLAEPLAGRRWDGCGGRCAGCGRGCRRGEARRAAAAREQQDDSDESTRTAVEAILVARVDSLRTQGVII